MTDHIHSSFYDLGIAPKLLDVLTRHKFVQPTAIQQKTIPLAIQGEDIVGIAQTGTGKTLAFSIPVIQNLASQTGQVLILVPTRELATQVEENFSRIAESFKLRPAVLIGGDSMYMQEKALYRKPRVFIATPGRLIDHLQRKNLTLSQISILVIDEADRMFDMGFAPQLKTILNAVPKERQTMLFSATMPKQVLDIATVHMKKPLHVEVAPAGTLADRVTQELYIVKKDMKNKLVEKLLNQYKGSVLIFTRTKFAARRLSQELTHMGQRAAQIHSDRSLAQRREALEGFKRGRYRVLVATDIASRGIDVFNIQLVINYDLPQTGDDYVHRIGRTARAGQTGHAISLAMPDQRHDVKSIESVLKTVIPIAQHPEIPLEQFSQGKSAGGGRFFRHKKRSPFKSHHGGQSGSFGQRSKSFKPHRKFHKDPQ